MSCEIKNCIPCELFKIPYQNIKTCPICSQELINDGYGLCVCDYSKNHYFDIQHYGETIYLEDLGFGFPKLFNCSDYNSYLIIYKSERILFVLNNVKILDKIDPKLVHWNKIDVLEKEISKLIVFQ